MHRTSKPYTRPGTSEGKWEHDRYQPVAGQLQNRIGGGGGSEARALAARLSGGRELLPDLPATTGPKRSTAVRSNAGVELFPADGGDVGRVPERNRNGPVRGVDQRSRNMLADALNRPPPKKEVRQQPARSLVSIMGAAKATTWVRVDNLALGTTAEDVISAFAPIEIISANVSTSSTSPTVSINLEVGSRADADALIQQFDGVVADGNALKVSIVNSLKLRIGGGGGAAASGVVTSSGNAAGQELLGNAKSSKLYSDMVLATDANASIITLADEPELARQQQNRGSSRGRNQNAPASTSRFGRGNDRRW